MVKEVNQALVEKLEIIQEEEETYKSKSSKIWRVLKTLLLGNINGYSRFEREVLRCPSDSEIVAKYSRIERFGLPVGSKSFGAKEIYLSTMRIPAKSALDADESESKQKPVVFLIHGLGGQTSQFGALIEGIEEYDVFAVDLPGCGHSRFLRSPGETILKYNDAEFNIMTRSLQRLQWKDFLTNAIVEMLECIIRLDAGLRGRKLILVGHSMGSHIAVKLNLLLCAKSKEHIVEKMIIMSPPDFDRSLKPPYEGLPFWLRLSFYFLRIPFLFSMFRVYDRLGGFNSSSVKRMVAENSTPYERVRLMRWNLDSDSKAWFRYASGFKRLYPDEFLSSLSAFSSSGPPRVLLLGGSLDKCTPIDKGFLQMAQIAKKCGNQLICREVKNAGHSLVLEYPELVTKIVLDFLNDVYSP